VTKRHVQASHHAQVQSKDNAMIYHLTQNVNALKPGKENLAQKKHVLEKILGDMLILVLVMEHVEIIICVTALMPTKEMTVVKIQQTPLQKYQRALQNLQQNLYQNVLMIVSTMENVIKLKESVSANQIMIPNLIAQV
jgi:predicted lipase